MSGAGKGVWRRYSPAFDGDASPTDGQALVWDNANSEYAPGDPTLSEAAVRDVGGLWEVIVDGTAPPVAVTNEDEDDWIYGWVSD